MVACAVINCTVRSGQGFAMFKFPDPERDSERRKQWVDSIKLMKVDYKPTPFARVCERHFQNDQFVVDPSLAESIGFQQKKLRLKDNAVPTVFTPYDSEDKVSKQRNGVKRPKRRPRKRKKVYVMFIVHVHGCTNVFKYKIIIQSTASCYQSIFLYLKLNLFRQKCKKTLHFLFLFL